MSLRVLLAEDSPIAQRVIAAQLQALGHAVTIVDDGRAAVGAIVREHFDVVVCDWVMPHISGLQVCRTVRQLKDRPYTYFLLVTALEGDEGYLRGMRAGADDCIEKPVDSEHLEARMLAAARLVSVHGELIAERERLQTAYQQLEAISCTDPLTQLGNRRALDEALARAQAEVDRYGRDYVLAIADVDCFKKYNDTFGHPAGDRVLAAVGRTLSTNIRGADQVFRYGGEEFLLLFPEDRLSAGHQAMSRLAAAVRHAQLRHPEGPAGVVTLSAGVARLLPTKRRSHIETLAAADRALYQAKAAGRCCVYAVSDDGELIGPSDVASAAAAEHREAAAVAY